jgi:hypothetical protein
VDLIADPFLDAATAPLAAAKATLTKYDAIVLVLGVNDALRLTPTATWRRRLETLLDILTPGTGRARPVLVTGIPPISSFTFVGPLAGAVGDRHARRLNTATSALCDATSQATFVPLPGMTSDGVRHCSPVEYDRWAQIIAAPLGVALAELRPHPADRLVLTPSLEVRRQHAVDSLDLVGVRDTPALRKLVEAARRAFGTETALLSVLDGDRQWHLATAGLAPCDVPRTSSFCDTTIQTADGLVVRDTLDDPRFQDNPVVIATRKVRFYAGFPIETPGGERLGALCVLDSQPRRREFDLADIDLLRELALRVQRELWHQFSAPTNPVRSSRHRPKATRASRCTLRALRKNVFRSRGSLEPAQDSESEIVL